LGELDHQSLNHLLTESPWDHSDVLTDISCKADDLFKDNKDVGLLIDEVGFRKKGRYSACVGRQYLGCIGKHDNGQVAVVAGLSSKNHYCPIDVNLFMPKSWQDDMLRREKAKIPGYVKHQTKPQIALGMILKQRDMGIRFDYVGFDALYGSSFALLATLDSEDILFVGDIKENIQVSLQPVSFSLPVKPPGSKGRKFKNRRAEQPLISVKDYCRQLTEQDFKLLHFRDGTKQKIKAYFHQKEIWLPIEDEKILKLQLIIRKDIDGSLKYSLTNMHQESLLSIAKRQGQRVFVEKIFEEGKNQIGMGDYQIRNWFGFHKHMTLCFLAFYYMTYKKVEHGQDLLLTAPIIRKLVASTISSRWEIMDTAIELCLQYIDQYQRQIQHNLKRDCVT
jgi:SRSO17 transposase